LKNNGLFVLVFAAAVCSAFAGDYCLLAAPPEFAFMIEKNLAPYVPTHYKTSGDNYYVDAMHGNDQSGNGSRAKPWKSITKAVNALGPGSYPNVTVNVLPGTYTENLTLSGLGGNEAGWLVFRSSKPNAAKIVSQYIEGTKPSPTPQNIETLDYSKYILFDGFEMTGTAQPYVTGCGFQFFRCNHITILNSIIHDVGGAGIGGIFSDYFTVEGNIVYNTAGYNSSGTSGIDFYEPIAADHLSGFHNVISNNISFDNSEIDDGRMPHSEGHGIMCDDFDDSQKAQADGPYAEQTLIQNNISFNNGGEGIAVYFGNYVTIRNNTTYHNLQDKLINYDTGEIAVSEGSYDEVLNNIAVTDTNNRSGCLNYALFDSYAYGSKQNVGNEWHNNISFNGTMGQSSVGGISTRFPITADSANILGADPKFKNPPVGIAPQAAKTLTGDFSLQPVSPAIRSGTTAYGAPTTDFRGKSQTSPPSIGAFSR
jgi:hypothetical protein